MNRANATSFSAFFRFDTSLMVGVILGPLALFITKDRYLSIPQKFEILALVVDVFITVRDRIGSSRFLRRMSTSSAFAVEKG